MFKKQLFACQNLAYKNFNKKLLPTLSEEKMIGIPIPILRRLAKQLPLEAISTQLFLSTLPHTYLEENNLHAFLVERSKDFSETIALTERFLPYIDNWQTCDLFRPPILRKNSASMEPYINSWLQSDAAYTIRSAIGILLDQLGTAAFQPTDFAKLLAVKSTDYYVQMMLAWYFATALAKVPELAYPYLLEQRLPRWVHNKTIQKASESRRISQAMKEMLRPLKRK